ncbi:MAG: hypothetical protein HYZ28_18370 [Myxococcales bacterium]|nr:hypothetical protein [Myxococcales bacterium]
MKQSWMIAFALAAALATEASAQTETSRRFRGRVGLFGGVAMQKTDLELAAGYDFMPVGERLRLVGDLTLGLRTTEITLEPMAGVRLPLPLRNTPKLELYLAGLAGFNLTFLRGSTALAVPFRVASGVAYELRPGLGLGCELSVEVGPLMAPFADAYAAIHFGAMLAFDI